MATKSMAYDHPAYQAVYSAQVSCQPTTASTDVTHGKFVAFAAMKIRSIRGNIAVAGTNDAAGYDIFNGTTSFADCTVGTTAAKSAIAVTMSEQTLAAGGYIQFKTKANSATTANDFVVEYVLVPGADVTA